jgi:hypothetical protein
LNLRPLDYESSVLPTELTRDFVLMIESYISFRGKSTQR